MRRPARWILILLFFLAGQAFASLPKPFWKEKPELLAKIREDRAVIVSVRTEKVAASNAHRFSVVGVGDVSKPIDFCFQKAQEYSRLPQVSEHFRTSIWDPSTQQLTLVTQALGYQARMTLHIVPARHDSTRDLTWDVVAGKYQGMHGVFRFDKINDRKTEVSIAGEFEAKELPLPKVLMGFALEVVAQKVGERMRSYLESQPENSTSEVVQPISP